MIQDIAGKKALIDVTIKPKPVESGTPEAAKTGTSLTADEIKKLQTVLNGCVDDKLDVDGVLGPQTRKALQVEGDCNQISNGIPN